MNMVHMSEIFYSANLTHWFASTSCHVSSQKLIMIVTFIYYVFTLAKWAHPSS